MAGPGFGANVGVNWGGGGLIYVTNLDPIEGASLSPEGYFIFTVGVKGSLIDITKLTVTVDSELAFDGTVVSGPSFTDPFISSSGYSYSPNDNGYTFTMYRDTGFLTTPITVSIHAETTDNGISDQSYQFVNPAATFEYPEIPYEEPLITIPPITFTGEYAVGPLVNTAGVVFFSPAFLTPNTGSQIDVDNVEVCSKISDSYSLCTRPQNDNSRPFLWGPAQGPPTSVIFPPPYSSSFKPILNSSVYTFVKTTQTTAVGILTDISTGVSQKIII